MEREREKSSDRLLGCHPRLEARLECCMIMMVMMMICGGSNCCRFVSVTPVHQGCVYVCDTIFPFRTLRRRSFPLLFRSRRVLGGGNRDVRIRWYPLLSGMRNVLPELHRPLFGRESVREADMSLLPRVYMRAGSLSTRVGVVQCVDHGMDIEGWEKSH